MVVDRASILPLHSTQIQGVEKKDEVYYLGARIMNDGNCEEVRRRIGKAKSALFRLTNRLSFEQTGKETITRNIIIPIVTHGAET